VGGLDVQRDAVASLLAGRSYVDDISDGDVQQMLDAGFEPTCDPCLLDRADAVLICVPTPLSADGAPDLSAVLSAAQVIARHLRRGMLVVLESTTYPGTTEDELRPVLESHGLVAGVDFHLAFSPERVDPGNPTYGISNTPKIVGGLTEACTERAAQLYGGFIDTIVRAKGPREAETAKLLENTYRHINIALVNEMAKFCHELDIDIWDVVRCAATKPFGFQSFRPGPGVGGHCIPIDPNYLSHRVKARLGYPFRFVELAQEINVGMPAYVAGRAAALLNDRRQAVNGARILLLGVTYKRDIADQREAPSRQVGAALLKAGAQLEFHDPYVPEWAVGDVVLQRVDDVVAAAASADLVVVLQDHQAYDIEGLADVSASMLDATGHVKLREHVRSL
jgi:nucleotide sugar dehydrogenase